MRIAFVVRAGLAASLLCLSWGMTACAPSRTGAPSSAPAESVRPSRQTLRYAYFNDYWGHYAKIDLSNGRVVSEGTWSNSACAAPRPRSNKATGPCDFVDFEYSAAANSMYVVVAREALTIQEVEDPRIAIVAFPLGSRAAPRWTIDLKRNFEQEVMGPLVTPDGSKLLFCYQHLAGEHASYSVASYDAATGRRLESSNREEPVSSVWFSDRAYFAEDGVLYEDEDVISLREAPRRSGVDRATVVQKNPKLERFMITEPRTGRRWLNLTLWSSQNGKLLYELGGMGEKRVLVRVDRATLRAGPTFELPAGNAPFAARLSPDGSVAVVEMFPPGRRPEAGGPSRILYYATETAELTLDAPLADSREGAFLLCIAPGAESLFYARDGKLIRVDSQGRAESAATGSAVDFQRETRCVLTAS